MSTRCWQRRRCARRRCTLALLTGNYEPAAHIKLAHFGSATSFHLGRVRRGIRRPQRARRASRWRARASARVPLSRAPTCGRDRRHAARHRLRARRRRARDRGRDRVLLGGRLRRQELTWPAGSERYDAVLELLARSREAVLQPLASGISRTERKRTGPGGPPGLQNRSLPLRGQAGFDSQALPPLGAEGEHREIREIRSSFFSLISPISLSQSANPIQYANSFCASNNPKRKFRRGSHHRSMSVGS